jgi:hypothetical protein
VPPLGRIVPEHGLKAVVAGILGRFVEAVRAVDGRRDEAVQDRHIVLVASDHMNLLF